LHNTAGQSDGKKEEKGGCWVSQFIQRLKLLQILLPVRGQTVKRLWRGGRRATINLVDEMTGVAACKIKNKGDRI